MSEDKVLTRREFTVESALAMLATVAITVTGCGDDSPPTTPTPPATDKTGTVTTDAGHTHPSTTITAAQFTAGNAVTLTLANGTTTHTHTVTVSQAELTQISAGTRVQKATTTDNNHSHTVTFN